MSDHEKNADTPDEARRWLGWVLIIVAVIMVAQVAYQQYQNQGSQRDRQKTLDCISTWATDFALAQTDRTEANNALRSAQAVRDQAFDLLLTHAVDLDKGSHKGLFDVAVRMPDIKAYKAAAAGLAKAQSQLNATAAQHPYPTPPTRC